VKRGIFSKAILFLEDESAAQYAALIKDLREDRRPEGTLESILVEKLAILIWRERRLLRAESAEIENSPLVKTLDSERAQQTEVWDCLRADETSGGMLRHCSNPLVIQEAIGMLNVLRKGLEESGFPEDPKSWFLKKLYGLDHHGPAPLSFYHVYQVYWRKATERVKDSDSPLSSDDLKEKLIEKFDQEIERLEILQISHRFEEELREEYETAAALLPSQDFTDRLIRYQAHFSREFDRTLNQLERLQRIRRGLPIPPSIKIEL
jgi:hypothetical protein